MGLNEAPLLFDFEVESSEDLTYIPMAVRFNLDRFGLRISLAQWQMLPQEDRKLLARFPVEDDTAIEPNFDHALFEMLRTHANVEPDCPGRGDTGRSAALDQWPGAGRHRQPVRRRGLWRYLLRDRSG